MDHGAGGGYGSLCRLIYGLGFRGRYLIFDLPEFSALQRFFLTSIGILVGNDRESESIGVRLISNPQSLSRHIEGKRSPSLFIATWSLSETPIAFRERFLSAIGQFDAYLIAYQPSFGTVNNIISFSKWIATKAEIEWRDWAIPHIRGSRYLVGLRTGRQ